MFFFGAGFLTAGGVESGRGAPVEAVVDGIAGFGIGVNGTGGVAGSGVMMLTAGIEFELGKSPDTGLPLGTDGGNAGAAETTELGIGMFQSVA